MYYPCVNRWAHALEKGELTEKYWKGWGGGGLEVSTRTWSAAARPCPPATRSTVKLTGHLTSRGLQAADVVPMPYWVQAEKCLPTSSGTSCCCVWLQPLEFASVLVPSVSHNTKLEGALVTIFSPKSFHSFFFVRFPTKTKKKKGKKKHTQNAKYNYRHHIHEPNLFSR